MDAIEAMEKQWRREPPVGLLVASFLGFKPKAEDAPAAPKAGRSKADQVEALKQMFPNGVIGGTPRGG